MATRTFNMSSPGVKISEQDESLRIQNPTGTQVLVSGFACQGPVSEIIQITSVSELEAIFGIPTTAAERYFYYSCREVLNSPAVLNAIRLPYGASTGSQYDSYSALLYPLIKQTVTGDPDKSATWNVHAPTCVSLSREEYNQIKSGNYKFLDTSVTELLTSTVTLSDGIILSANKKQLFLPSAEIPDLDSISSSGLAINCSSDPSVLPSETAISRVVSRGETMENFVVSNLSCNIDTQDKNNSVLKLIHPFSGKNPSDPNFFKIRPGMPIKGTNLSVLANGTFVKAIFFDGPEAGTVYISKSISGTTGFKNQNLTFGGVASTTVADDNTTTLNFPGGVLDYNSASTYAANDVAIFNNMLFKFKQAVTPKLDITTGVTNTLGSSTLTLVTDIDPKVQLYMTVTGTGIPIDTYITAIDYAKKTITLNKVTTAAVSSFSVTLLTTSLPGFLAPATVVQIENHPRILPYSTGNGQGDFTVNPAEGSLYVARPLQINDTVFKKATTVPAAAAQTVIEFGAGVFNDDLGLDVVIGSKVSGMNVPSGATVTVIDRALGKVTLSASIATPITSGTEITFNPPKTRVEMTAIGGTLFYFKKSSKWFHKWITATGAIEDKPTGLAPIYKVGTGIHNNSILPPDTTITAIDWEKGTVTFSGGAVRTAGSTELFNFNIKDNTDYAGAEAAQLKDLYKYSDKFVYSGSLPPDLIDLNDDPTGEKATALRVQRNWGSRRLFAASDLLYSFSSSLGVSEPDNSSGSGAQPADNTYYMHADTNSNRNYNPSGKEIASFQPATVPFVRPGTYIKQASQMPISVVTISNKECVVARNTAKGATRIRVRFIDGTGATNGLTKDSFTTTTSSNITGYGIDTNTTATFVKLESDYAIFDLSKPTTQLILANQCWKVVLSEQLLKWPVVNTSYALETVVPSTYYTWSVDRTERIIRIGHTEGGINYILPIPLSDKLVTGLESAQPVNVIYGGAAGIAINTIINVPGAFSSAATKPAIQKVLHYRGNQSALLLDESANTTNNSTVLYTLPAVELTKDSTVSVAKRVSLEFKANVSSGDSLVNKANMSINPATKEISFNAGMIVLNDLQTTINDLGEGYYIGLTDNFTVRTPNYQSVQRVNTLTKTSSVYNLTDYTELKPFVLSTQLMSSETDKSQGKESISSILESVPYEDFKKPNFQDYLSFGIFRLIRSSSDSTRLNVLNQGILQGSLDWNKMENSDNTGLQTSGFIEDKLVGNAYVKCIVNPAVSEQYVWKNEADPTLPTAQVLVAETAKALFPLGTYVPETVGQSTTKVIGNIPNKLDTILSQYSNTDNIQIDIVADSGLSSIFGAVNVFDDQTNLGNVAYDDKQYINLKDAAVLSKYKAGWSSVANAFITFCEEIRRDCITIIDLPRACFVSGKEAKIVDAVDSTFQLNVFNPIKDFTNQLGSSSYATTYGNWAKILDIHGAGATWLPFSGYAAAIFGRSDDAANVWAAPAGFNRGEFRNVVDIAINPNQTQRDNLYQIGVNPVVYFNGEGYTVFGQKTIQTKPTAFDRINVRRLFLYLERAVARTVKYFVFEPNTDYTRKRLKDTISPVFNYAKSNQGLYDYMIVCDERNNTPDIIDQNILVVDIYIKPVRTAEFILVNFVATRTGQNFQELI